MRGMLNRVSAGEQRTAAKPYPSWADVAKRMHAEGVSSKNSMPAGREWRDLVADMIVGRR